MTACIIDIIERELDTLSRQEAAVAQWILASPQAAARSTIAEAAAAASVSEPTVIRFCRRLGLSGFRELKPLLIAFLQRPGSFLHHDVSTDDSPNEAAAKVLERSINTLIDLRGQVGELPFSPIIKQLKKARQLIFVGTGASGLVADDACHKFFRLGLPCCTALDMQTILQRAAIARKGDVFIAISHNGRWPELVRAMSLARENGAHVIALTDPQAPLAQHADTLVACHPPEDTNIFTPMSSRLAQLALLDALQVALALGFGPRAEQNLRSTKLVLYREQDAQ